jgi:hypothetical protein
MDRLAAEFSSALYRSLVAGKTIDEAVSLGRLVIRMEALNGQRDIRDWGVPVLYLRAPGGRVFQPISDDEARNKAEEDLGHLIEQQVRVVSEQGKMTGAAIGKLSGGTISVSQNITENVKGIVVGAKIVNIENGQVIVKEKADVVEGSMDGLIAEEIKGGRIEVRADVGEVRGTLCGAHIGTIGEPATRSKPTTRSKETETPSKDESLAKLEKMLVQEPSWYG